MFRVLLFIALSYTAASLSLVVFVNIEDAGVDGSTAYLRAHIETLMAEYNLVNDGTPIDLCIDHDSEDENNDDYTYTYSDDDAYNDDNDDYTVNAYNVDDAYFHVDDAYFQTYQVNDAEKCPQNGVYEFEYEYDIPCLGHMWRSTGWKAYGSVNLAAGGKLIGSCELSFETKAFGISSKAFFAFFMTVMGLALFVGVFLAIRRGSGWKASDDARDFHWMGGEMINSCVSRCRNLFNINKKEEKKQEDLESTFDTESTPSYSEKNESLDTTFDTNNKTTTQQTARPSPIRIGEVINSCPAVTHSSPLLTKQKVNDDIDSFQYQFHEDPPSPIRNDEQSTDHPSEYVTLPSDNYVSYSPPRADASHDSSSPIKRLV